MDWLPAERRMMDTRQLRETFEIQRAYNAETLKVVEGYPTGIIDGTQYRQLTGFVKQTDNRSFYERNQKHAKGE